MAWLYEDGPEPVPMEAGDVNSDDDINLLDALALISNLYDETPGDPELICPE